MCSDAETSLGSWPSARCTETWDPPPSDCLAGAHSWCCYMPRATVSFHVHKSIGCSHRSCAASGEWEPCQRQELGSGDTGCVTPAAKVSVMFTELFWEDFAWENFTAGSDSQATWARETSGPAAGSPWDCGCQLSLCCAAKQIRSRAQQLSVSGEATKQKGTGTALSDQAGREPLFHPLQPWSGPRQIRSSRKEELVRCSSKHPSHLLKHRACRQLEGNG